MHRDDQLMLTEDVVYKKIRLTVAEAQQKVYAAVNFVGRQSTDLCFKV